MNADDVPPSCHTARAWRTDTRYYNALVQRNLFGQWELVRAWGGRGTRLGSIRVVPAESFDQAMAMLDREVKRRAARHYLALPAVAP